MVGEPPHVSIVNDTADGDAGIRLSIGQEVVALVLVLSLRSPEALYFLAMSSPVAVDEATRGEVVEVPCEPSSALHVVQVTGSI